MVNYWVVFIYFAFIAFLVNQTKGKYKIKMQNTIEYRYRLFWAIIMFLPLIYIAGMRTNIGDTYAYIKMFNSYPSSINEFNGFIQESTKDKGFVAFSILIKQIFGADYRNYFIIIAIISGVATLIPYKNNSCNYLVSIFLFLASTDFMSWMLNGMRQYLVASLLFLCMGLIVKKKYILFIIITVILSTFHQSALIMIPIVFIVQGDAWNKKMIIFLLIIMCVVIGINEFTDILDEALIGTSYDGVVSQFTQDDGTNIVRILVYSVPTIIAFIYRKKIKENSNKMINICINMSIVSMGFYIVSKFTSGIYIGRIPIYFSLYNYILLPWEIELLFEKKIKRIVYYCMMIGYLAFYYIQMYLVW